MSDLYHPMTENVAISDGVDAELYAPLITPAEIKCGLSNEVFSGSSIVDLRRGADEWRNLLENPGTQRDLTLGVFARRKQVTRRASIVHQVSLLMKIDSD